VSSNKEIKQHLYFENLDATRFLGFFHVFLAHCFFTTNAEIATSQAFEIATKNVRSGFLGLDYFFVLSSFLLTWLALAERKKTGKFKPGLFLIRRGLRLWPLYLLLVLATYSFVALAGDAFSISALPPIEIFLLFWSNLWMSINGQDFLFLLVFFWSIAAEEQFYLFWAFVMRFLSKYLLPVIGLMICSSLIFRYIYLDNEPFLFFNTVSYLGDFAIGALAAFIAFGNQALILFFRHLSKKIIAIVYVILLILTAGYFHWFMSPTMVVIEKLVFSLFFAFVILEQNYAENSLIKLGRFKRMSYLGQLSLGLYCYHGIVLTFLMPWLKQQGFATTNVQVFLINPMLILACTILISIVSYELFEKHIHALRRMFYPNTSSRTSGV
jgi:peptidoglycan/LPS O-acetylase OafA/YrhL